MGNSTKKSPCHKCQLKDFDQTIWTTERDEGCRRSLDIGLLKSVDTSTRFLQLTVMAILLFYDLEESEFTAYSYDSAKTVDSGHGRIEVREAWTITDPTLIAALRTSENGHSFLP